MLCAATFSNSYVKWRLLYVMLRFVAVTSRNRLAGRYDNPIPTWFLAPLDCYKIPAL
jgi:hypothetical protein